MVLDRPLPVTSIKKLKISLCNEIVRVSKLREVNYKKF
jgi:hypothetical protein